MFGCPLRNPRKGKSEILSLSLFAGNNTHPFFIFRDSANERKKQLAAAKLKLSIQELRDEKEKATKKEDYAQAAIIKKALPPFVFVSLIRVN